MSQKGWYLLSLKCSKRVDSPSSEPESVPVAWDEKCSLLGIPTRLHRCGRPADQNFESTEELYRWFVPLPEAVQDNWIWHPVSSGDMSVNRGKYSVPEDVLYNTKDGNHRFGKARIATFLVEDISILSWNHPTEPSKNYKMRVIHEPEDCMYPHSNVQVLMNGDHIPPDKLPKTVKTQLRRDLTRLYKTRE